MERRSYTVPEALGERAILDLLDLGFLRDVMIIRILDGRFRFKVYKIEQKVKIRISARAALIYLF